MKLEKNESSIWTVSNILLIPILFAIGIIPMIVKFVIHDPNLSKYAWFTNTTEFPDMFMYGKQVAMVFLDIMLIAGFLYLWSKNKLPQKKAFVPIGMYFLLILLSSLVSVSPYHTWNGFSDMMESAFVLFGYCMLCYYTYAVVKTEKQLKKVIFAFLIGILIVCLIGLSQFLGCDFFMSDFGKSLVFTGKYSEYRDTISPSFETGRVSTTLYNPNYVGVYSCLVIPFLLILAFSVKQKKYLLLYAFLLILMACSLVGSGSKTAIITLCPCFLFILFYFGRKLGKKIILVVLAVVVAFVGLNIYQGERSVFKKVLHRLTSGYEENHEYALRDITLNDENFTITYEDTILTVQYLKTENNEYLLEIKDEDGNTMPVLYSEEKHYYLEDEFYDKLTFQVLTLDNKQIGYMLHSEGCKFNICYSPTDETYYHLNLYGRYTKMYSSETFDIPLFHLMGGFSGRDFIWGKSIPILKDTLFLGSGPDTYTFMFPQYDYIASAQNGYKSTLITKPHNTYLQIGIQTGVLSLLAYIGFYVCYLVESVKIYWKRDVSTFSERCGLGIFISSVCYMIAGLINDSTIGVSVIFWTFLGLGYACNQMIRKSEGMLALKNSSENKKWNFKKSIITVCVFCMMILGLHLLLHRNDEEPRDGRAIFETNAIQTSQTATVPYQAVMSVEWTFENGTAISKDAYVENVTKNQNDIYFDVKLETGELLYTSPIVEVGTRLENIALDTPLSAGEYKAVVTYHLLDDKKQETATAQIAVKITVQN